MPAQRKSARRKAGVLLSHVNDGFFEALAARVIGERARALCGVAQIHEHEHTLVFGQAENSCGLLRIKAVEPAAVNARVFGGEQHVCGDNCGILHAGIVLLAGIDEHVRLIEGHNEHGGRAVAAGCYLVDLGERLWRAHDVDALFLKVLRRRREPPGLEYNVELCVLYRTAVEFLAGLAGFYQFRKFHIHVLPAFKYKLFYHSTGKMLIANVISCLSASM